MATYFTDISPDLLAESVIQRGFPLYKSPAGYWNGPRVTWKLLAFISLGGEGEHAFERWLVLDTEAPGSLEGRVVEPVFTQKIDSDLQVTTISVTGRSSLTEYKTRLVTVPWRAG